jgi:hypothetical protein
MTICQWFLLCDRPATGTTPHPVLGSVPTCDRCHKFATGEDRQSPKPPPDRSARYKRLQAERGQTGQ